MSAPQFYLVAEGNAFAIDGDDLYGAPVNDDGTVDWDCAYDFDPCDEDVEYVAHMCYYLKQAAQLHTEHTSQVFVKWTCYKSTSASTSTHFPIVTLVVRGRSVFFRTKI